MFAAFAILGWSMIIIAAIVTLAFAGFTMFLNMMINACSTAKGTAIPAAIAKWKTMHGMFYNPIVQMLDKNIYGDGGASAIFFGPIGTKAFGGTDNPMPLFNQFQLWFVPVIMITIQLLLIVVAAVALRKVKKHQLVSQPFMKLVVILAMAFNLVVGKMYTVIAGGTLFTGLVMLEILLFNHNAVQNFAEEQSLKAIGSDEKKFAKEAKKSKKLSDVDSFNPAQVPGQPAVAEIKYSEIPSSVTNPEEINNKKYRRYYIQWKMLKDQLDKFRAECHEKAQAGLSERARFKLQSKFNERAEKINVIAQELKLVDSFKEQYIDLSGYATENSGSTIMSGGALNQATTAFGKNKSSSTDYDPGIESIYNSNSTAQDGFKAPQFSAPTSAPTPGGKPETFVVPTTMATRGMQERRQREKELMQYALAQAIRMDFSMIPMTNDQPNFTIRQFSEDNGIRVETKDISFGSGNTKIISPTGAAPTPSPEYASDGPSFDTKVTEPPKFGGLDDDSSAPAPQFTAPGTQPMDASARPETFIAPATTVTDDMNARRQREKELMQYALAQAIRMDWGMLPASGSQADSTIHQMEQDLGLQVETRDFSYSTKQIQDMLSVDTAIIEPPKTEVMSAPSAPSFGGGMPSAPSTPSMPSAPAAPSFGSPAEISQSSVTEMRQVAPNSNGTETVKIDQIERRMENIEKMIQSLSLTQNYQAPNANIDDAQVAKLKNEFSKIEEQLGRISQSFDISSTEPKNLFGALIRGYKYNNKK